jgi:hypothetical protein
MLRRMSSSLQANLPANVSTMLKVRYINVSKCLKIIFSKTVNEWNFDVFVMNDHAENQCLRYLAFELMQKYNILTKYRVNINIIFCLIII